MATGLAAAAVYACVSMPAVLARVQSAHVAEVNTDGPVIPADSLGGAYMRGGSQATDGTHLGTIAVPQIDLNAPVVEGVTDSDLRRGVGHVPGSALGGGLGNMVLAAHRDTIFRALRGIQKGMDVEVRGTDGVYHYKVDSLQVVAPDRLDILEISSEPQVTLITCYPFNFIGSAPMRFIVKAHLVSPIPDTAITQSE